MRNLFLTIPEGTPKFVLPALECQGPKETPSCIPFQNVDGTNSMRHQTYASETGLKSVRNQSIDHAVHFLSGGSPLSNSDSEAPSVLFFGTETGLKLIGTTSPASDSNPCCYVSVMRVDTSATLLTQC